MEKDIVLIQIRMPKSRKEELRKIAKLNGYTLNSLVNKFIIDYIKKNKREE